MRTILAIAALLACAANASAQDNAVAPGSSSAITIVGVRWCTVSYPSTEKPRRWSCPAGYTAVDPVFSKGEPKCAPTDKLIPAQQ